METPDNGFIVAGASTSNFTGATNQGSVDGWAFKLSSTGTLQWQRSLGGTGRDVFRSFVRNETDGSYTFAGSTTSPDLYGSTTKGNADAWVLNLSSAGDVIKLSKTFGGSKDEEVFSINTSANGGWLLTGYTESNDGNVSDNNG